MNTKAAIGLVLAGGLLASLAAWRILSPLEDSIEGALIAPTQSAPGLSPHSTSNPLDHDRPPLPDSLMGTDEDGALVVDHDGKFNPTPDAIDLFDYYLSTVGEEPTDLIHTRIRAAIQSRLTGPAARDAERLLKQYLQYREEASSLVSGDLIGEDLERRLQYIRELRRKIFGAEIANTLFGEEEDRWFVDLERRRILLDTSIDSETQAARLALLDESRSAPDGAFRDAIQAPHQLREDEARIRTEGGGETEIAQIREERFGLEGAGRLSALDESRAAWGERLNRYRMERDELIAETPTEAHSALIAELQVQHFKGGELIRLRALDRIALELEQSTR